MDGRGGPPRSVARSVAWTPNAQRPAAAVVLPVAAAGMMMTTKVQPAFVAFKQTTAKQRQ